MSINIRNNKHIKVMEISNSRSVNSSEVTEKVVRLITNSKNTNNPNI